MKWFINMFNAETNCSLASYQSDSSTATHGCFPKQCTGISAPVANFPALKLEFSEEKLASSWAEEQEQREDFLELVFKPIDSEKLRVFDSKRKHIQKTANKASNDYRKNICAYITKKVIREFISDSYRDMVIALCQRHGCTYPALRSYYLARVETVTGLRHLADMLIVQSVDEKSVKEVFSQFLEWFLKERYVRYIVADGRMQDRRAYLDYKNKVIAGFFTHKRDCKTEAPSALPLQT